MGELCASFSLLDESEIRWLDGKQFLARLVSYLWFTAVSFLRRNSNHRRTQGVTPAEKDPRMEHVIDRLFRYMDTDHDGRISRSEWKLQEKQFRLLDKNGDGFITKDEVRTDMMGRMTTEQQQQKARHPR